MSTNIKEHYFEYGSLKYFRGNAHMLEIATYGEKKDPVGSEAYLEPYAKVKREYLSNRVVNGVTVGITWSQTNQAEVEVNGALKVFGLGLSTAVTYNYSKVKSANVKLHNFFINEAPLKTLLNTDADGARKFLKDEGNDGRTVSEVWVVMEAELSEHFDTTDTAGFKVSALGADLQILAKGGKHGTQTIVLSPGSIFAYKNHKVKSWNGDLVDKLEADYYGNG